MMKKNCLALFGFSFIASGFSLFAQSSAVVSEEPEVEIDYSVESVMTEDVVVSSVEIIQDGIENGDSAGVIAQDVVQNIFGTGSGSEEKTETSDDEYGDDLASMLVDIPDAKRPKKADSEKIAAAQKKDEDNSEYEENQMTLAYGTPSEINKVVDDIVEGDDPRYTDSLYELFQNTGSNEVREKILGYFAKLEDPCLEDYAVEIIDDPYDTPLSLVQKCMTYASDVHSKAAAPALVKLLDAEDEKYFNSALSALGKTGGKKEALYLAKYLQRDDLETPQRQALMRTLGQMCAVETFDQVVEIAEDEDENSFVRMYAAEAIGNMKKEEAIPVLINMYENGDPNMREYCIKGLQNFPSSKKAKNTIIQAVRDEHVKVRLQAVKAVKEMKMEDAMDFLIYRAKNDSEPSVKKECYPTIAELDTKKGNDFLIEQITEKKTPDSVKAMASEALLKNGKKVGVDEIVELAKSTVNDDKRKTLRYSLGKLISKNIQPAFAEVAVMYIQSKDAQTAALGLDMYKAGRYETTKAAVKELAEDKTRNSSNRKRARKLLGLEEEEEKPETTKKPEPVKAQASMPSSEGK